MLFLNLITAVFCSKAEKKCRDLMIYSNYTYEKSTIGLLYHIYKISNIFEIQEKFHCSIDLICPKNQFRITNLINSEIRIVLTNSLSHQFVEFSLNKNISNAKIKSKLRKKGKLGSPLIKILCFLKRIKYLIKNIDPYIQKQKSDFIFELRYIYYFYRYFLLYSIYANDKYDFEQLTYILMQKCASKIKYDKTFHDDDISIIDVEKEDVKNISNIKCYCYRNFLKINATKNLFFWVSSAFDLDCYLAFKKNDLRYLNDNMEQTEKQMWCCINKIQQANTKRAQNITWVNYKNKIDLDYLEMIKLIVDLVRHINASKHILVRCKISLWK